MTTKAWGFLISRALAILGFYILVQDVEHYFPGDLMLLGPSYHLSSFELGLTFAIQGLACLAFLWMACRLWVRAPDFAGLIDEKSMAVLSDFKVASRLILYGLGLYFTFSGISGLVDDLATTMLYKGYSNQSDYWRLAGSLTEVVIGVVVLMAGWRPTWLQGFVSWAKGDFLFEEEESEEEEQP